MPEIIADHGLAHLEKTRSERFYFQLTVETSDNEHDYEFEHMKLGRIALVRKRR